jgi:putative sigma-54 modulation protein
METQIQSIHFDADTPLREFVWDKVQSLNQVYDRIEDCIVTLKLDKDNKDKNKVVEVDLGVPGRKRIYASERAETFEEAAVQVTEELRKQLIKWKGKLAENVDPHFFIGENPAI